MHYSRRTALQLGTLTAVTALTPPAARARSATSLASFANPTGASRPWVRWWWPGGAVSDPELRREIAQLRTAGFGGGEIQAFNPAIPGLTADERSHINDYADDTFFAHVKVCCEEALKDGIKIDYTFGSAWPSGGGFAITPELALVELTPAFTSITAPFSAPIKINLPKQTKKFGALNSLDARSRDPRATGWQERLEKRWRLIAVVAVKGDAPVLKGKGSYRDSDVVTSGSISPGAGINITDKVQADGTLDWAPPESGNWQIIAFKQFTVDSGVMAGVGEGPQLVLDHFNKAAFEAHAGRVGAPLDKLGVNKRAIRAMFIDSLELMTDIYWSDDFLEQFVKRRGYDLTPYLPYILQPGWEAPWNPRYSAPYYTSDDTGDRVRFDYRQTVSELMIENFWKPFTDWCQQHGFESRLQAHGGPTDLIKSYGLADIPETEDLGANGDTHFLRLARAAADIYGKSMVSCESLCWIARPYDVTPADWLARSNFLFASGVSQLVMHGFPYALHAEKWPGWFPFEPSAFLDGFSSQINENNPLWAGVPTLNTYVHRAQEILREGKAVVPLAVLVVNPGNGDNKGDPEIEAWLTALLAKGYDYDRISYDGLQHAEVKLGRLRTISGFEYTGVLVPPLEGVQPEILERLLTFQSAGLKVSFVDHMPTRAAGLADKIAEDRRVAAATEGLKLAGARILDSRSIANQVGEVGIKPNVTFLSEPCLFVERDLGGRRLFVFHNPKDRPVALRVRIDATGYPTRLDLFNGKVAGLKFSAKATCKEIAVDLVAGGAAFILFQPKRVPVPPEPEILSSSMGPVDWSLAINGHGHKSRVIDEQHSDFKLQDLSQVDGLTDFSGQAVYAATLNVDSNWLGGRKQIWLDLGAVHDMAVVSVNGKDLGTLIAKPFEIDISKAVHGGPNTLVVRVFNGPNNAMMDPKAPGLKKLTLKPSGLIGPIQVQLKA